MQIAVVRHGLSPTSCAGHVKEARDSCLAKGDVADGTMNAGPAPLANAAVVACTAETDKSGDLSMSGAAEDVE